MRALLGLLLVIVLVITSAGPASARRKKGHTPSPGLHKRSDAEIEAATRLQVFLDRANFSPGKIDGHYSDFTLKALALYHESRGEPPSPRPPKADTAPDLNGIDVGSVGPVFIQYAVTEADLQNVGPVPNGVPEKAKLNTLPYRDAGEAIAEKFHCDPKFLGELNPGKNSALKPGDQVRVPNAEPFELGAVKDLEPGSEIAPQVANDNPDEPEQKPDLNSEPTAAAKTSVKVDVKTNMLGVFEGDKIIAAYPVTVGSTQTATPIGEWKVRGVAKLPTFRYDEQMLKRGERSKNFHMLPPGPNSPVGVVWIALYKRGVGIHGTDEPSTIGQAVSHGCIRLANWDIVRLAGRVKAGVPVSVH